MARSTRCPNTWIASAHVGWVPRVAQCGQLPTEYATSVDIPVSIFMVRFNQSGSGTGVLAVHHDGAPTVFCRPVVPNRQTELVRLTSGVSVQSEIPHLAGAASLHLGLHPGVRDHQSSIVEYL